ncbi:hypothetical protein EZS27_012907 [termite gut metagenome]|uniref:TIR domain-containing protein n=1 Tax=termite gut metagenome TaxID=433724 RepID=A0A5J4S1G0_9ZZZZ
MDRKDFFISYTVKDQQWAKWIAGTLEANGYTTIIQAWDFKSGENFVLNMDDALKHGERFIAVLSKKYLEAPFCQAEWSATFTRDPASEKALFIPVRVEDYKPEGLLAPVIYIDLVGKNEEEAEKELVDGVSTKDRPRNRPGFPGTKRLLFPGELPFNNLAARNLHFTGRIEALKKIHQTFETEKAIFLTQVVKGLGGIGKTQIAQEYAFRYAQEYEYIWWMNAETDTSILQAYTDFAHKQHVVDLEINRPEIIIETVRNWMSQHDQWLFIFDNAEKEVVLKKYLPAHNFGQRHILITSRYAIWEQIATSIGIAIFASEEAANFLTEYTRLPSDEYQNELAKDLGYLPLALEQAAAYIRTNGISYQEYLDLFRQYKLEILKEYPDEEDDRQTIYLTWNISIEKINKESAKQLLNLCAFLASENIQCSWFSEACEHLPQPLQEDVQDKLKYNKVKVELKKYSLVQIIDDQISIHRLVQEVIKDKLGSERANWKSYCVQILNKLIYDDFSTAESRNTFNELVPHIISISLTEPTAGETKEVANLYFFLGYGFNELGNYSQSLAWYQKALIIDEKVLGKEHLSTVTTYNNMATVYSNKGEYDQALAWHQKALEIREKVLGKEHSDTATTYNNMALVYSKKGEYNKALVWHQKALEIREKVLGKEHLDTAITYNNMASVYNKKGEYNKALVWFQKALEIREKVLGKEHPDTAATYNNMAGGYYKKGEYDKALAWYQKALEICDKVFGKEHPYTATTYNNMAEVYDNKGDYGKALAWYQKALEIREKVLGKKHPDTATTYNNMAAIYDQKGDYDKALSWYQKALEICERVLDKEHPYTAATCNNIALVYSKKDEYGKALAWVQKALEIREKVLGKEHPDTATTYNNMALVYFNKGKYDKALDYYLKCHKIFIKKLGSKHPHTMTCIENMKITYNATGKKDPFENWLKEIMNKKED